MEMTTVSPSPASPTEGDNLCEIDGTNVAIHSVTLLICLCGLVGNGAVLRLLSLKVRNYRFFELAFTDFIILLFTVTATLLFLAEDMSCYPVLPPLYLSFLFRLLRFSGYVALIQLTPTRIPLKILTLCVLCMSCMFWCRCNLPERLLWLVNCVQLWVLLAFFSVIDTVVYLCPSHKQERCWAAFISTYAYLWIFFAASVVIFHTIDFIKAMRGSQQQKPKTHNIVLFLMVLLIFLFILCNFLWELGYIALSSEVFFLLTCIQSSIKPFIYFLAGRCWSPCSLGSLQLSLQRVFGEQEEEAAHSNDASTDTESDPGDSSHCSADEDQETQGFLEAPDFCGLLPA